jgi:predicted nucleic acid-binding protein
MSPAVFVDTNIVIYATGEPHRLKDPSSDVLSLAADYPNVFVTSAEVFQELLHHFVALHQWQGRGQAAFDDFSELMANRIEGIDWSDVFAAAELAAPYPRLSARDLVHLAVMNRLGITRIVSADRGFDQVADIERLDPADVDSWRELVVA